MIEYKLIRLNNSALPKLGKEGRELTSIYNEIMYFKKKIVNRKTKSEKEAIKTKERKEFYELYKNIKNSGLSNDSLILKYNKLVEEGQHNSIIQNLKDYKIYLEVRKKQEFALMAQTYINQARYKDKWEIVADFSKKFINDIYKEKELTKGEIDYINNEIYVYEKKHSREVSDFNVREMIKIYLNK